MNVEDEVSRLEESNDTVAVGRAADGDPRAFEVLVRRYSRLMRSYARNILGSSDEVDDVVQESFVVAWQQLESLQNPAALKSWLMRIVGRRSIDRIRVRHDHDDLAGHDEPTLPQHSPEGVAQSNSLAAAVDSALSLLPVAQRRCWVLKEVGGYSYREIAEQLDLPESTIRGLIARSRIRMANEMEHWR